MTGWRQLWERVWDYIAASALGQRVWARYEAAAPREQLAMKLLCAFLLLLVALLLVMPLHGFNANATAAYREQLDTLAWMQANRKLVGAAAPVARKPGESLLTVANQSARGLGLSFKRYEPRGDNGLNLWLEKVPFNQVVAWLGVLEKNYGVVALEFSASRRSEAGLVDVKVVLEG
jgi:general secretion pathway protein M